MYVLVDNRSNPFVVDGVKPLLPSAQQTFATLEDAMAELAELHITRGIKFEDVKVYKLQAVDSKVAEVYEKELRKTKEYLFSIQKD